MDTITPLTSIFPVGSVTSQSHSQGKNQQTFSQGQLIVALVLENQGKDRFILDIGGNRLTARSEAALSPGQSLRLEVVRTSPEILLKIVTDTPRNPFYGRPLNLLRKDLDIAGLYQAIRHQAPLLLENLSAPSREILESFTFLQHSDIGNRDGGAIVKQLLEDAGLNLEQLLSRGDTGAALRTVKAALLEIANSLTATDSIAQTANRILTTLELFQLVQVQSSVTQLILPLPLPFVDQGYLVVEKEPEDESLGVGNSSNRFSLHLTMTGLGNLRIDFLQNSAGLYVRFHTQSNEKADFIAGYSEELRTAVSSTDILGLTFTGDAPDPINELVRQIMVEHGSMLDTKV